MTGYQGHGAPAPGWYADPSGQAGLRWWDGVQWTAHTAPLPVGGPQPAGGIERPRLPGTTPVYTPFIWVIVLLPLLSTVAAFLYQPSYRFVEIRGIRQLDPTSLYTPAYFALQALGLLLYALTVVLAYFDHRTLRQRGVVRPFHWAWMFLSIVYPIGRSVIVHRVARPRGLVPVWVLIGATAINLVVGIVLAVSAFNQVTTQLQHFAGTS